MPLRAGRRVLPLVPAAALAGAVGRVAVGKLVASMTVSSLSQASFVLPYAAAAIAATMPLLQSIFGNKPVLASLLEALWVCRSVKELPCTQAKWQCVMHGDQGSDTHTPTSGMFLNQHGTAWRPTE